MSYSYDDRMKYLYALGRCDIQRLTALVHSADIDPHVAHEMTEILEQIERRWSVATMVRATSFGGDADVTVLADPNNYGDGRPVTTRVHWEDGWLTIVHNPDPDDPSTHEYEFGAGCLWSRGHSTHTDARPDDTEPEFEDGNG
jgi:hypothetical protein